MDGKVLAITLKDKMSLSLCDAQDMKFISTRMGKLQVQQPNIIIRYPECYLLQQAIALVRTLALVKAATVMPQIGLAVFQMQPDTHTEILYGVNILTDTGPMQITSGSEKLDKEYNEKWGKKRNLPDQLPQCNENGSKPLFTEAALKHAWNCT